MTADQAQELLDHIAHYGDAERVLGIRGRGLESEALDCNERAQRAWTRVVDLIRTHADSSWEPR